MFISFLTLLLCIISLSLAHTSSYLSISLTHTHPHVLKWNLPLLLHKTFERDRIKVGWPSQEPDLCVRPKISLGGFSKVSFRVLFLATSWLAAENLQYFWSFYRGPAAEKRRRNTWWQNCLLGQTCKIGHFPELNTLFGKNCNSNYFVQIKKTFCAGEEDDVVVERLDDASLRVVDSHDAYVDPGWRQVGPQQGYEPETSESDSAQARYTCPRRCPTEDG